MGIGAFYWSLSEGVFDTKVLSLVTESSGSLSTGQSISPPPAITSMSGLELPTFVAGEEPLTLTPTRKPYTPTPTKVALPTLLTSTPAYTITPTPIVNTPTSFPLSVGNYSSQEINGFIDTFSAQYGQDPNVLRHIAVCESGFNPQATNGPYMGLYQFSSGTWVSYRSGMGEDTNADLRLDAQAAVRTASYVLSVGMSSIWPNCVP